MEQKFFCSRAVNVYYDAISENRVGSFQYDLSLNAAYRSAMKGPVIGPFVFTYYVFQSVFFSILQENVVKKGKKLICRFNFEDNEFLFARLEFTAVSRPTEMRRLLISFNKGIMQRGQATKKFKQKKENYS